MLPVQSSYLYPTIKVLLHKCHPTNMVCYFSEIYSASTAIIPQLYSMMWSLNCSFYVHMSLSNCSFYVHMSLSKLGSLSIDLLSIPPFLLPSQQLSQLPAGSRTWTICIYSWLLPAKSGKTILLRDQKRKEVVLNSPPRCWTGCSSSFAFSTFKPFPQRRLELAMMSPLTTGWSMKYLTKIPKMNGWRTIMKTEWSQKEGRLQKVQVRVPVKQSSVRLQLGLTFQFFPVHFSFLCSHSFFWYGNKSAQLPIFYLLCWDQKSSCFQS